MARVTIEDCRKYIPNRFELVILSAQRAKDLSLGIPPLITRTKDKDPVLALREIAAGRIDYEKLRELVITKYMDPIKRIFSTSAKKTPDIEDIFKDLAMSVEQNLHETHEDDEYEGDIEELERLVPSNENSEDEEIDDDDEIEEPSMQIKHQDFDVDITFEDADVDD